MISYHHIRHNGTFAAEYTFTRVGDALPKHRHDPWGYHDVNVLKGSVRVNDVVLVEGDHYIPDNDQIHEIVALKAQSVILNKYLNGEPEDHKHLTDDELKGVIDGRPS